MKDTIKKIVMDKKDEIIQFTKSLIQIPSITGDEEQIIDYLVKDISKYPVEKYFVDEMGNLIIKIGSGKKILAIDGHVDTVLFGELEKWTFHPLSGKEQNGLIFGRGSCDQKGGLATAIMAAKILLEIGVPDNLTLYIVASIQEETYEGKNWQFIVDNLNIKPDAVLLTEPSNLAICLGHRGRVDIKIEVEGISSHGAEPDLGDNAIYKMVSIVKDIEQLHQQLPKDPVFGKSTITVTEIQSQSVSLNAVADKCIIHIDRRLGSKETKDTVINELLALPSIKKFNAEVYVSEFEAKSYKGLDFTVQSYYPTWIMQEDDTLVKIASESYYEQFEIKPELKYWRFSTNGIATKGFNNIPTIGFGPGDEKLAHTVDENIPIDHLITATEFYLAFILKFAKK
ncbi:MAG: YgeY family selenium metabolism-linked hydrolase [Asgard group archaeon]|nr:YgeY family selenium metabolism-linked hydrolase [Asgard group archaeon]